jgi:hypothetical protein
MLAVGGCYCVISHNHPEPGGEDQQEWLQVGELGLAALRT